jgi:hypothetical protein
MESNMTSTEREFERIEDWMDQNRRFDVAIAVTNNGKAYWVGGDAKVGLSYVVSVWRRGRIVEEFDSNRQPSS